ncbi:MAG: sodium:calcium antiporter [Bacteroidetes bacterium]|nr:sodium:proton exchanger [Rhodothermaceae bacterium RA]RMH52177.1 MAG: sodium:calcium antiporter [Bacteroidota bacterium]
MLLDLLIFVAGLVILYLGAEWLVRGAASLALEYGIRPLVVGLTVVALGTSMPEFVLNFFAVLSNEDSLALGNIVGSNICNIALILGTSAVVLPLTVAPGTLKREYAIMLLVTGVFYLVALDGVISQLDGLLLVAGLVAFVGYLIVDSRRRTEPPIPPAEDLPQAPGWKKALMLLGGVTFLAVGAHLMVTAAQSIAHQMGIDPVVVGLTVLAVGTSLPELAASVVSAIKKEADLSVGNVLGSNMLNVLFVVGLLALFKPMTVEPAAIQIHFPVMIAFSVLLFPLAWTGYRISRLEGGMLLTGFVGYIAYLVMPYV